MGITLIDDEEEVVAAINMSVSSEDAGGESRQDNLVQFIELARVLSSSLGYDGPCPKIAARDAPGDKS